MSKTHTTHKFIFTRWMPILCAGAALFLTAGMCGQLTPTLSGPTPSEPMPGVTQSQEVTPTTPENQTSTDESTGLSAMQRVLYTRTDLKSPDMGSAWGFSPDGKATYYAFWTPGPDSCEVDEYQTGTGSYTYENGQLTLENIGTVPVTIVNGRQTFTLDIAGQWSGDPQTGVSGPNMVVGNGMSGTYTQTACLAP